MTIKVLPQVKKYIGSLPEEAKADLLAYLKDIQEHGLKAPLVTLRHIEAKLWEIKADSTRVFYFMFDGNTMILLHGYKKQGQKAPRKEIEAARKRMKEFLAG